MARHLAGIAIVMYATAALAQTVDSPLVAAARRGADARRRAALAGTVIYTNDMVSKSTRALSTTSGQAAVAPLPPPAPATPSKAPEYAAKAAHPDAYSAQAASDPRLPRVSNNGSMSGMNPQSVASPVSNLPPEAVSGGVYRPPQ